uniref:Anaphase-promoting complex subunit 4 WD40 domain-containing protein n=1 Tax=Guillardia theta TaxID=55529 RepID=A0A7S4NI56_GUITH
MSMSVDHVEDRYMLVGYANGGVAIIDVSEETVKDKKFECALRIPQGQAHDFGVTSLAWYTRDTGLFVSGGFDEVVKIWDTNKAEVAIEYKTKGKVYDIDVHKTSTLHNLVAAANGHVVSLYDANSGLRQHSLRGHQGTVNCVAWSVCEQYQLFSGGSDGTVRLWDVRQGASCLAFLSPEGKPWTSRKRRRTEHDGTASSSSKGDEAALLAHAKGVSCLRFTPDGRYLLSSGGDERVRLWNPVSCELEIVNYGAFPQARAAAYKKVQFDVSWSGKLLFHPCQNEVVVCDLASGNRISRLRGHVGTVKCCVAKPRGEDLFSGDQDANILVWTPNDRFLDGEEEVEVDVDNWSDSD